MSSDSYTTDYDDEGTHIVTVTVSDGSLTDSQDVTVIVNDADTTPPLAPAGLSIE
jgi:PKD repeat protein